MAIALKKPVSVAESSQRKSQAAAAAKNRAPHWPTVLSQTGFVQPKASCACGGGCPRCRAVPNFANDRRQAGTLHQSANGETGCDVSAGTPSTTMHDPPPCYRACVERHEKVHAKDIAPCCKRANAAYKQAKTDDDKAKVQDKFNRWVESNVDWLECRAYAESSRCAQEFLDAHCETKSLAEESGVASNGETGRDPLVSVIPMTSTLGPELAPDNVVLEEGESDEPPSPEACCSQMKTYRRVSAGRRDTVCGRANKMLTACPW
jgi:hypothetical protein